MPGANLSSFTRRGFLRTAGNLTAPALASAASRPTTPGDGKLRIGVVGGRFGLQFQWHLHPDCEIAAVCDIRPSRLKALAKTYETGNTYRPFRDLLKHPTLDAVAVFTPAPLHTWMSIRAMEAGKHVVSAVPAGLSIEELERLIDCVRRTGRRYMMAETT